MFEIAGPARAVLTGERTGAQFPAAALRRPRRRHAPTSTRSPAPRCRILDTRKTLPGLRTAQKYAVRCGGADNHRIGLFDLVLIKENHIAAAGSISAARSPRPARAAPGLPVEVEVEITRRSSRRRWPRDPTSSCSMSSLDATCAPRWRCATRAARRVKLEASGSVSLENGARDRRRPASTTSRSARSPSTCGRWTCRCDWSSTPAKARRVSRLQHSPTAIPPANSRAGGRYSFTGYGVPSRWV